MQAVTMQ